MESARVFLFDENSLQATALSLHSSFCNATPFPHVVIDDFLPGWVVQQLVNAFPRADDPRARWRTPGPGRTARSHVPGGDKIATSDEASFPPVIRQFMTQLNSWTLVQFLEALTGTKGLIVDPGFGGGGLHSTGSGGRLMIHTDVNRHTVSSRRLHQAFNLILFLNDDWQDEYGGHLELWTADRQPAVSIAPLANRCVIFETGTKSFHGQPRPVSAPAGRRRNSLAVYYYTIDRALGRNYSGFQPDVNWEATTPEDHEEELRQTARLLDRLRGGAGRRVALPAVLMPAELCDQSGVGSESYVTVRILDWNLDEHQDRFRLNEQADSSDGLGEIRRRLRPFATSLPSETSESTGRALTIYVDTTTGKIYGTAFGGRDIFWLGYGDFVPPYT